MNNRQIESLSRIVHEVNKVYCETQNDFSQKSWDEVDESRRVSTRDGVTAIINGSVTTPEESHENWMKYRLSQGWTYGKVKDDDAKTHPSLVPYSKLSSPERFKDALFHSIVMAYINFIK